MHVFVLQPTGFRFQVIKGRPKIYQTLEDLYQACQSRLNDDLAYHQRKRGGAPYTDADVNMLVHDVKLGLKEEMSPELIERIVDAGSVYVTLNFCNDTVHNVLHICKVKG